MIDHPEDDEHMTWLPRLPGFAIVHPPGLQPRRYFVQFPSGSLHSEAYGMFCDAELAAYGLRDARLPTPWRWDRHPEGDVLESGDGYSLSWGPDGDVCVQTPDGPFRLPSKVLALFLESADPRFGGNSQP